MKLYDNFNSVDLSSLQSVFSNCNRKYIKSISFGFRRRVEMSIPNYDELCKPTENVSQHKSLLPKNCWSNCSPGEVQVYSQSCEKQTANPPSATDYRGKDSGYQAEGDSFSLRRPRNGLELGRALAPLSLSVDILY